jgi:hypothetical protein
MFFFHMILKPAEFRGQWNEFGGRDPIGIDVVRICRFAATRNAQGEFLVRRNVADFLRQRELLGIDRLRYNQQAEQPSR